MKKIVLLIVIFLILISGYFFYSSRKAPTEEPQAGSGVLTYSNPEVFYSFNYPSDLTVYEYLPATVAIGSGVGDMFSTLIEVQKVTSDAETTYSNFNDFVYKSVRNYCAADGPNETIFCTTVKSSEPFTSKTGLTGEIFTLVRTHRNLTTGKEENGTYGPIYAFNVSANNPGAEYTALIIRPGAALPTEEIVPSELSLVANSLVIHKVESRPDEPTTNPSNDAVTLKVGEKATVGDLTIQLNSIVSDSRCPDGAECIQAGSVVAEITLSGGKEEVIKQLDSAGSPLSYNEKEIAITSVTPRPVVDAPVPKGEYEVTFAIK